MSATSEVIRGARYLIAGLEKIEGVEVMGSPVISCVAWTSKIFNIYNMSSDLTKKGWNLAVLQFPAGKLNIVMLVLTFKDFQSSSIISIANLVPSFISSFIRFDFPLNHHCTTPLSRYTHSSNTTSHVWGCNRSTVT